MVKKIKVILKKTDKNIGQKENIINVNAGYAFNYLIPHNIAEVATEGKLKHFKMFENIKNQRLQESKIQANIILSNLTQISKINIKKKNSGNQQIFGRVNEKEIINRILMQTGHLLDKKQINLPEIKQIGIYVMTINILSNMKINLNLQILPEDTNTNF